MQRILVAPGDGVGPEVTSAALHVVGALGLDIELVPGVVGKASHLAHGEHITDETVELAKRVDAVLFGATESPPSGVPYRSPLLTLRRRLDLFANVRPARALLPRLSALRPPRRLDVVIVRENTEGLYVCREREEGDGFVAERLITRRASERIHKFAFDWAARHGRRKVTCVHKANVLRMSDGLFLRTFQEIAASAPPGIARDDVHVDTAAAMMVQEPASFDVIVTSNLFGDILSDLAAGLVGGLGFAPSANIGERHALFEPVHGSAPGIAGRGVANPTAAILSAAMMLDHLGHAAEARRVERAVTAALRAGVATRDAGGRHSTMGFARAVRERLGDARG